MPDCSSIFARAGGATEHKPCVLRAADALFRTADDPWCSTWF
jgi:hypothetical protein